MFASSLFKLLKPLVVITSRMMRFTFYIIVMAFACQSKQAPLSTPTTGKANIGSIPVLNSLMQQEKESFENIYPNGKIQLHILNEKELMDSLISGVIPVIALSRQLTTQEKSIFQSKGNIPRETHIATDAFALLTGKSFPERKWKLHELKSQLLNNSSGLQFVFDKTNSTLLFNLMNYLQLENPPAHFYAVPSLDSVLQLCQRSTQTIGIIQWSAMSDLDDPFTKNALQKVRYVGVLDSLGSQCVYPDAYLISDHSYPLVQKIYMINVEGRSGLATGFTSFVAGEIGQKIFLKAGLLPSFQTERWIELKNQGVRIVH